MKLMMRDVRLSFPKLFVAKPVMDSAPSYGADFIIDPESDTITRVRAVIESVAKEKWGKKSVTILKKLIKDGRISLKDGDNQTDPNGNVRDGYGGMKYVTANRKEADGAPNCFKIDGSPIESMENMSEDLFAGGDYVHAIVEFWAQDNKYGKRINCQLVGVQFVAKGERFGGVASTASAEDFDDADMGEVDEDLQVPW